jgi:hypothetical protein
MRFAPNPAMWLNGERWADDLNATLPNQEVIPKGEA